MRYAVLSFPRLPIQLARRLRPDAVKPLGLLRGSGDGALLAAVSVEASAGGVEAGMTVSQARQRCPGIEFAPEQPARVLAALEAVVAIIRTRATPHVAILSRNELVLSLDSLDSSFADEGAAALSIVGLARNWSGLDVRCAVASSIAEASAAARTARRFPVLCPPNEAAPEPLPRFEPLSAHFAWDAPVAAEAVDSRIARLGATLAATAPAWPQSYREVRLEVRYGSASRVFTLRPEAPLHTVHEALSLIRTRVPLAELAGATEVRFTLAMPGPDLHIDPWRAPVATLHQLTGPALPVQRRLLRAS